MFNVIICNLSESYNGLINRDTKQWVDAFKQLPDVHVKEIIVDEMPDFDDELIDMLQSKNCSMLCYNNVGTLIFEGNENIWEKYDIDVYSFLMDHPRNFSDVLLEPIRTLHVICLDMNHVEFIHMFYPNVKDVIFLPDSSVQECTEFIPYNERPIDVLFLGSCQKKHDDFPAIDFLPDKGVKLYEEAFGFMLEDPSITAEYAVEKFLHIHNLNSEKSILYDLFINRQVSRCIEDVIRREYKLLVMHALDVAGIKVDIYGDKWEDENPFSENITIHPRVPCTECYKLIGNAKINLSLMPWFKKGSSEKPFAGMLNGAVCVSDTSTYLEETYIDGIDIMLFDLNHIEKASTDIIWLLNNPLEAEIIAQNGYWHAKDSDSTDVRVRQFLDIMKKNSNGS